MLDRDPLDVLHQMREFLDWFEANIRHDPESPAAKDAAERISAAYVAMQRGFDWETIRWGAIVGLLESVSTDGTGAEAATARLVIMEPGLDPALASAAVTAWRTNHGKWDATLRLLDDAGIYKNPPRHLAAKPSEYLRQRWAQLRQRGVPPAFRPPGRTG